MQIILIKKSSMTTERSPSTDEPEASRAGEPCARHATRAGSETIQAPRSISSSELLDGQLSVAIDHEGMRYVLRATRAGKLILTK